jgi:hypothetical protein
LSQNQMGALLGSVHPNGRAGRAYTRSTICHWECQERGQRLRRRYQMNAHARQAYASAIAAAVSLATQGRVSIEAQLGRRAWRIVALTACAQCARPFAMRRISERRCPRCRR